MQCPTDIECRFCFLKTPYGTAVIHCGTPGCLGAQFGNHDTIVFAFKLLVLIPCHILSLPTFQQVRIHSKRPARASKTGRMSKRIGWGRLGWHTWAGRGAGLSRGRGLVWEVSPQMWPLGSSQKSQGDISLPAGFGMDFGQNDSSWHFLRIEHALSQSSTRFIES